MDVYIDHLPQILKGSQIEAIGIQDPKNVCNKMNETQKRRCKIICDLLEREGVYLRVNISKYMQV